MKLDGIAMGARRRGHLAGALTLAVAALAVAGCGGGSSTTTSAAAPATTATTPATTATATTPAATSTATTPATTATTPAATATTPAATTPATTATTAPAKLKPASVSRGKSVFGTSCRGCHTLADTGPGGTIGPNLDQLRPADATVVAQVTNGGGAMPSFAGTLSRQQIVDVARYVSTVAGRRKK